MSQSDWDKIEAIDYLLEQFWYEDLCWWEKLLVKVKLKKYDGE
jgi:hypothetical protein